jgi:hypothetical protein
MYAFPEPAREKSMATVRDKAFKILTEREISEILNDTAGRTPRKVDGVALGKRAKSALFSAVGFSGLPGVDDEFHSSPASSLTYDECEGTDQPYWGTWGAVQVDDNILGRSRR